MTYITKQSEKDLFLVINSKKNYVPESLYKYYSVSNLAFKFSVDAFLRHYLFASHPLNLNDKYDCSEDLIDYSKLNSNFFVQKMVKRNGIEVRRGNYIII